MSNHKKFFTVEEANTLLPKLNFMVEKIRTLKTEIAFQIPELGPALSKAKINGGSKNGANYVLKLTRFYDHINSIMEMGCMLKDIDLGLIDFPSIREGREVYLCWRFGEDRVSFWHDLDAGFNGRKPI
ncbi:MAG: DUF2203 domain-containing protein [Ignavibacteriales bacterium]